MFDENADPSERGSSVREAGRIYPVSIFAKSAVMALLAVALALAPAPSLASWFCPTFLKKALEFKHDEFVAAKQKFVEQLRSGEKLTEGHFPERLSPTRILALIEASGEVGGTDVLHVSEILNGPKAGRDALLKFVRWFKITEAVLLHPVGKTLSLRQAEELAAGLYLVANPAYPNLPRFLSRRIPPPVRKLIRQRIETELASTSFEEAAANLGFLRSPGAVGRLRRWLRKNPLVMDSISTIALNTILLKFTGYPGYPPKLLLTAQKKIPPELLEKIRLHGFDAGYEDAKRVFGASAKFETGWKWARAVFAALGTGVLVYFIVEHYDEIRTLVGVAFATEEDRKKYQEETFNCEEVRAMQFQSWKKSFLYIEGRMPDPEKDKQEWDKTYNAIYGTPCDKLKVKFD